ncbi:MAG: SpaA isopeptide-forming pilin-related protein [Candidatus Gastranaerophilaceae bacterium]
MKRKVMKRGLSALLALLMCFTTFLSMGTTVFAATEVDAYMVDFPRDGDANYSSTTWGHPGVSLMSGWSFTQFNRTTIHCLNSYTGQVAYCIEPGVGQYSGDTLSGRDESYWENYPASNNVTISPDTVKVLLGRIMQYGYHGNVSTSWRSQNASDAACLSHALATQLLVWEVVVGERDASFNKVNPAAYGKSAVWEYIGPSHPLRSQIQSYYSSMVTSVQNHTRVPSFCARSYGSASTYELKWNGTNYTTTLTDTNGVLSNFSFSSSTPSVSFSRSGNQLTITANTAIVGDIRVSAAKNNGVRSGVVTWTDGRAGTSGIQDMITYGENVSDPVSAYMILEMEAVGTMRLVKTSEDGVVSGIPFTISGNGITRKVTTGVDGTIDVTDLIAGTYTVTEADIDRYTPQSSQQVTIVGGQTSTVTFSNVLKHGSLEVVKSSEDNFVEGAKFHLYGTSLSGLPVDEYAVTDANGVARFGNVLISGSTPYTIEEVETAIRYVIPDAQTVSIQWNEVAERSFVNILKKFTVTVTKTDSETGEPQGDSSLANARYGIYKSGELIDVYHTDANGQFTSREYICDTDWTVQEIEPSEGYLLDTTVHSVGADPALYTIEHNTTSNAVTEDVIKGNIRLIKHIDAQDEDVEIVPSEPEETPAPEPEPPVVEADPELEPENSQEPVVDEAPKPEASADSSEETAPVDGDGEPIPETFAVATQTDLPDEQNAASDPELEDPVETPQPEPDMDESTETPQPEPDVNESVEPPSLSRKQIKTWSRRRFLSRTSRLPATRASSSSPRRAPDSRFT